MQTVNEWTIKKWNYLKKYLHAYTTIISCYFPKFIYIDAFSGEGKYGGYLGSPLIALNLEFPFTDYIFIEKNKEILSRLKNHCKEFSNRKSVFYRKDNKETIKKIDIAFKNLEAKEFIETHLKQVPDYPCFIFLDPYGIEELDMKAVKKCSEKNRAELLINFSVSGIIRNVSNERCHELITNYYGSDEWKNVSETTFNRGSLYAELYIQSLKNHFKYIIDNPIRGKNNVHLYHLIFTTNNQKGYKIMSDVMQIKDKQTGLSSFFKKIL